MLIERIALCWLHVHVVETRLAQFEGFLATREYWQRRLDRAHKRHLSAIKALVQVRKMALPAPSVLMVGYVIGPVNVGGHQVNVANTGKPSPSKGAHDPEASRLECTTRPTSARTVSGR
jgi:hypothetical protein